VKHLLIKNQDVIHANISHNDITGTIKLQMPILNSSKTHNLKHVTKLTVNAHEIYLHFLLLAFSDPRKHASKYLHFPLLAFSVPLITYTAQQIEAGSSDLQALHHDVRMPCAPAACIVKRSSIWTSVIQFQARHHDNVFHSAVSKINVSSETLSVTHSFTLSQLPQDSIL